MDFCYIEHLTFNTIIEKYGIVNVVRMLQINGTSLIIINIKFVVSKKKKLRKKNMKFN